jgi:hypothetical protein
MTEIKCQRCKPEDTGCGTCGGYKVVLLKARCDCGRENSGSGQERTQATKAKNGTRLMECF